MIDFTLMTHQVEGVKRALELGNFGFFFDVGTGKTATVITTCRMLFTHHKGIMKTLIISPLITLHNWEEEWQKFSKIPKEKVVVLEGSGANKVKIFNKNKARGEFICIINYEALLSAPLFNLLVEWAPDILILDESQKVKSMTSKRTKQCIKLGRLAKNRFLLSGTPILKNQMDIFSQMLILDNGRAFGDSLYRFKLQYFYDKNASMPSQRHFPDWRPFVHKEAEMQEKISQISMSVKKEDCLDLPPLIRQKVYVELSAEQRKHYEMMKKNFISYLEEKTSTATIAIVKALRLQQITTGYMPLDDTEELVKFKENPRMHALKELLEDLTPHHKVIVWACFRENYEDIRQVCKALHLGYVELTGDVASNLRHNFMHSFNTDSNISVLIGNPVACGLGINLIASDVSIYYSRNFSLEADLQSEARNYRAGSEIHKSITRIDIVAKDTIDEIIIKALAEKKEIGDKLLRQYAYEL